MTKILSGVMGIVMTGAVVTASAYALWSAQATVSGINFFTGSLALEVSPDGDNWANTWDADLDINGVVPGWEESAPFFVRYFPGEGEMDVSLQLTAATGWNDSLLRNYIELAVVDDEATVEEEDYMTLAEWNDQPHLIVDDLVAGEDGEELMVHARLREDAPNSLQGKSLTDITFTFTGETDEDAEEAPVVITE